jgi:hypothetical protein
VLAIALLLQTFERVSDAKVFNRATFDTRWCVAVGTVGGKLISRNCAPPATVELVNPTIVHGHPTPGAGAVTVST